MKIFPIEYRFLPSLGSDAGIRIENGVLRRLEPDHPNLICSASNALREIQLSTLELTAIERAIERSKFFEWDNKYSIHAFDGWYRFLTIGEKTVEVYIEGPPGFDDLAKVFEALMDRVGAVPWSDF